MKPPQHTQQQEVEQKKPTNDVLNKGQNHPEGKRLQKTVLTRDGRAGKRGEGL